MYGSAWKAKIRLVATLMAVCSLVGTLVGCQGLKWEESRASQYRGYTQTSYKGSAFAGYANNRRGFSAKAETNYEREEYRPTTSWRRSKSDW